MQKHTPGPWAIGTTRKSPLRNIIVGYHQDSGSEVVPYTVARVPAYSREDEANAVLIQSAPELLDALRGLVAEAGDILRSYDEPLLDLAVAIDEARAAIAKAEGREEA